MEKPGASGSLLGGNQQQNPGHVRLHQLYGTGERLQWALAWSDGTEPATVKAGGTKEFDLPKTRTWNVFQGHIKQFNFAGFEVGGEPIQGVIAIKRSTKLAWIVKEPTP